jgi:hypothetical protein
MTCPFAASADDDFSDVGGSPPKARQSTNIITNSGCRWSVRLAGKKRSLPETMSRKIDDCVSKQSRQSCRGGGDSGMCHRPKPTSSAFQQDCGILPSE